MVISMKICGVELSGNDANVCLLSMKNGLFQLPDFRAKKVSVPKACSASDLRYFQRTFAKLVEDYKIDKVVIKQRPMKGKFAGGAIGFKLEAALELIADLEVEILSPTDIKGSLKRNPVHIPFRETDLKSFQQTAFETAYAALMLDTYGPLPVIEKHKKDEDE